MQSPDEQIQRLLAARKGESSLRDRARAIERERALLLRLFSSSSSFSSFSLPLLYILLGECASAAVPQYAKAAEMNDPEEQVKQTTPHVAAFLFLSLRSSWALLLCASGLVWHTHTHTHTLSLCADVFSVNSRKKEEEERKIDRSAHLILSPQPPFFSL
jgi:hypothetical protein